MLSLRTFTVKPLVTTRLRLRPCTSADATLLLQHWRDADVRRFMWDDELAEPADIERIVRASDAAFAQDGLGLFVAHTRQASEGDEWKVGAAQEDFVGSCGLRDNGCGAPELMYSLTRAFWGAGYAAEAAQAVLDCVFRVCQLPQVAAEVDEPNVTSIRVLNKLGFVRVPRTGPEDPLAPFALLSFLLTRQDFLERENVLTGQNFPARQN